MGIHQIRRRPAVFLDRDGVIVRQEELLTDVKKIKILPEAMEGIRRLNRLDLPIIVVSNQPVVARGLITEGGVRRMNKTVAARLARKGARIDAFYFCPHHPNANLPKYRVRCGCRKPGAGMLRRAARELGLNLKSSWMIGDGIIDVVAGKRAGTKTILVRTGPGHARLDKMYSEKPDFTAEDLNKAADIILKSYRG